MVLPIIWMVTNVDPELNDNFRKAIRLKYKREIKRGDLRINIFEAVNDWIRKTKSNIGE